MFTVEQRDSLRERVLALARQDSRVVAGAAVGSLAVGGGDRCSDLDLTFAVADDVPVAGPRFRLLFGETAAAPRTPEPPAAADLFGWGVVYGLHARACIDRGRVWQAEHYVGAVRDHALSFACLRHGLPAVQARGYDDLPSETLAAFEGAHLGSLETERLRAALSAAVRALLAAGEEADVASAHTVAQRLAELL